jgi:hypothetical protein
VDASEPSTGQIDVSSYPLWIGENSQFPGSCWNGLIDDVRIFNRALSHEEIQAIMLSSGGAYPNAELGIAFPIKGNPPVGPKPPDDPNTPDGFDLYLDDIAPNIINSSWFDEGILDYYCQDNPASGNYCIHWTGVGQYSAISFRFVPVKDLSVLVDEGYAIDFWVRCNSPEARIDIRFVDTKTNDRDHPWRMLYTVDRSVAVWDGRWNHLQILLNDFSEHGSWDNDRWYNPVGAFDWTATEHFEIMAEYSDLVGIHFYFDDIRVIDPKPPGRFPLGVHSADSTGAEKPVHYYKAGDVGAFSVDIEIPSRINVKKTIFTVQASNEKAYLLYVESMESVESVAESVLRANLPSQRLNMSKKNLWAIGIACIKYANDHDDKNPPNLQELVEKKYLLPKDLESPFKPSDFDGTGYIYIAGQKTSSSPRNVVVYENPEFFSDSINVLFMDTHVEVMTPEKFLASLEATYKRLRRTMPEVSFKAREPAGPTVPAAGALKIFGRYQDGGKVKLDVFGRYSEEMLAEPSLVASVELNLPPMDGGDAKLLKEWATAQTRKYRVRVFDNPHTSYYQYCLLQSQEKYGLSDDMIRQIFPRRTGQRGRGPNLYAMTTGALAIQESLQLEEMTGRREIPLGRDVAISTLKGPTIKSHPFEEMLQGRTSKVFPVTDLIPYDNYYCHFSSISKEIAASDLFKQWGGSLLRAITVSARDSDLPSRYMNQLCVDLSALTRLFGDFVIGEVAITGGDPFMKEGTDVALIIQVKSRRIFDRITNGYANVVLRANQDAQASQSEYEGVSIRSIVTPDRRVSSHSAYLGEYKVNSNSMDTLKLIIDTFAKKRKSMADNLDLQYMRTIFPGTAAAEDGFIYLSDSFIRKLLSPRWKIEAQRRIVCQNHLRMIANAGTMYRSEMRKKASIETLIQEKYLSEKVTRCPDRGTYSLDESGRAFCTVHNCLQYCTPISSVSFSKVADVEVKDYRQFVERYSRYWSRFFDPIGIRLRLGDRIEAETCIMPLIENSIYNQLREIIGGEPVRLDSQVLTDHTIVSITSKLGIESNQVNNMRRWIQKEISFLTPEISKWIGESLSVAFYDSDVLFTFAEEGMGMFGGWMNLEGQIVTGLIASSVNLPLYFVIELKDENLAKTSIRRIVRAVQWRFASQNRGGLFSFGVEPYAAGEYKGHEINTLALQLFVIKFRLHYAIASNRFILSTKRYVLEEVLDSIDRMQASTDTETTANLHLKIQPRAFDRLRPITRLGWQERMRSACLMNIEPVRVLVECHNATEQTLNEVSRKVEGVTLRCPSGGSYINDSERNIVYCSVHGNNSYPRQPVQMTENEGILDFIGRMIDFSVEFKFTEEGIMTKLAFELEPEVDAPTVFTWFTCSMHPQVKLPKTGECPMCAMPLIPVADTRTAPAVVFSCSMHPQIKMPKTGKCAICGMDLVLATPQK